MKFSIKITPSSAVHFKVILKNGGRVKYVFREVYYFAEYLSASTFNYLILLINFL